MKSIKDDTLHKISLGLLIIAALVLVFNSYQLAQIKIEDAVIGNTAGTSIVTGNAATDIIPTGIPGIYGPELGISFDDVSASDSYKTDAAIRKLGNLDTSITLSGQDKERYVNVLYKMENGISCEYCCGARAIIFENGEPACGCAHSYAMRGLAKYLITNHGEEYSDAELLEEVGKWKVLFFPGIHETKAAVLESQGIELNYINLASNKYRGIEQGQSSGGSMVGGC